MVGCIAFCLRAERGRRLLWWFELPDTDKEALRKMLKDIFKEEVDGHY